MSTKKEDLKYTKKSIWGEFSALSGVMILVLVLVVIGSIAAFVFMNMRPEKKMKIIDDAEIFSESEIEELEDAARKLKDDNDINVVIVTTRHNPEGTADEDCKKFAAKIYKGNCIHTSMQDNSGICILIDLTLDYDGGRFFWIYTYGTAFFSVDNEECQSLFGKYKPELKSAQYFDAIDHILDDLQDYDYHSSGLIVIYGACIIIPLLLAGLITLLCTFRRKLDKAPNSSTYIDRPNSKAIETTDTFIRKSTRVYHTSSSSGGGGGGGGGGGHSGGGGGRF